mgnify:CR=1 FL=1
MAQPKYTLVDPEDYERLSKYEWEARRTRGSPFYVARQEVNPSTKKYKLIFMHREIIEIGDGLVTDHINNNTVDNRKANLRPATQAQNNCNRRKFAGFNKSKYKGVYWKEKINKWVAQIGVNKKIIHLGCFKKPKAAARAYDEAAKKYHGQFASLNLRPSRLISLIKRIKRKILVCSQKSVIIKKPHRTEIV